MGYLRDFLLYLEPALLPELATYETEIFAATAVVSLLTFLCKFKLVQLYVIHSLSPLSSFNSDVLVVL